MKPGICRRASFFLFFILCSFAGRAGAAQVSWGTEAQSTDLDSGGKSLTSEWIFELGAFAPAFTPTAANTALWKQNWTTAARSAYDEANRGVAGARFTFTSNASPYTTSNRGWIWGYHPRRGEWILFGDTTWRWPDTILPGPPPTWGTTSARDVIVGALNTGGVQLRTATVTGAPPALPWAAWQAIYFSAAELSNPAISGPDADPDGDRVPNAVEYLTGTAPRRFSLLPLTILPGTGVEVALSAAATGTLRGEVSTDLLQWHRDSAVQATAIPGGLRFTPVNAAAFSARAFWRFGAVLP